MFRLVFCFEPDGYSQEKLKECVWKVTSEKCFSSEMWFADGYEKEIYKQVWFEKNLD